jgi:proliferating cell nuclear antigen
MNISAKTSMLLDLVNAANVLVEEANFHLSADGLSFRSMDPSHIAMINVLIPPTDFAKYEVTDGVKFALRTQEVAKILKRFDKDEELTLALDGEHLIISNQRKTFKTRTLESSGGDTPIPSLRFDVLAKFTHNTIDKTLADVNVVSEFLTVTTKPDGVLFSGKGDSGEVEVVVPTTDRDVKEKSKTTYSLDYIIKMVKAVSVDMVTLEYSSKMPLKLSLGRISYFLAPRVAED